MDPAILMSSKGGAYGNSTDPTLLMAMRVAPFVVAAGLVFGRRTHTFHVQYLRQTLRRPMSQHLDGHAPPPGKGATVANPVLDDWLGLTLNGRQKRIVHVVAGEF